MFRITAATLLASSLASLVVSPPAHAKAADAMMFASGSDIAHVATRVCVVALESRGCARYQDHLLRAVAQRPIDRGGRAALEEIGRRQLDALVASFD